MFDDGCRSWNRVRQINIRVSGSPVNCWCCSAPTLTPYGFAEQIVSHVAQILSIPLLDNNPEFDTVFHVNAANIFFLAVGFRFEYPLAGNLNRLVCLFVCVCVYPKPDVFHWFLGRIETSNGRRSWLCIKSSRGSGMGGRRMPECQLPLLFLLIMFSIRYFREWICYLLFGSHVFCSTVRTRMEGGRQQQQQQHATNVDFKDLIELDLLALKNVWLFVMLFCDAYWISGSDGLLFGDGFTISFRKFVGFLADLLEA